MYKIPPTLTRYVRSVTAHFTAFGVSSCSGISILSKTGTNVCRHLPRAAQRRRLAGIVPRPFTRWKAELPGQHGLKLAITRTEQRIPRKRATAPSSSKGIALRCPIDIGTFAVSSHEVGQCVNADEDPELNAGVGLSW